MMWSGWDTAIVVAAAAQVAGLGGLVWVALKIKNGPVTRLQKSVGPLTGKSKTLFYAGKKAYQTNREQGVLLIETVREAAHTVQEAAHPPALSLDAPINYQKMNRAWAGLKTAQQGVGLVRRFAKKGTPLGKPRRISFAERIGLIPPAGKPVGRLLKATRTVLRVRGLLKASGKVWK